MGDNNESLKERKVLASSPHKKRGEVNKNFKNSQNVKKKIDKKHGSSGISARRHQNDTMREKELAAKSNIEDIFSNLKVKEKKPITVNGTKQIKKNSEKYDHVRQAQKMAKKRNPKVGVDKRACTPDGLPIYSMEELKMGQGGYTKECPFECNCCF
ncbi:conserved protein, unknown function [Plasmodium gonderi]|uniref:Uncharacterized protein n=1 Tax=Plasmodium gonderi TaxID=77519 RepID=A0A1Y1JFD2_PLAGO|nr:conserved protein, unknown function [Plasmodium gonderi]GAW80960.1 conserved protein, unknown function [Plasmodium gonderi]